MKMLRDELDDSLNELRSKLKMHPDLFVSKKFSKPLLDALFEIGAIPTYSFPKNLVSTYILGSDGKIKYRIERGLDIAVSECAPGRSIVVDKKTYQIGGLYHPSAAFRHKLTRSFLDDPNYVKAILTCRRCGCFGLDEEKYSACPFCGNRHLTFDQRKMLKPWGFAPREGKPISEAQSDEEYSTALPPEYSTLPENDEMIRLDSCKHIRIASRKDQRIIMINRGAANSGFVVCSDCGAAMPDKKDALKGIGRPYKPLFGSNKCSHSKTERVNLGFDFVTDMLVLEIELDDELIDTRGGVENLWLERAAQTLAEAFRLVACKELDVDFAELVTGYRIRRAQKTFIDVYIYDNLSSGASYSVRVASEIETLLERMKNLLSACDCTTACSNCLKHYRNQFVHGNLDRHYGLQLLDWGLDGRLAEDISEREREKYLASLKNVLSERDRARLEIYPAMRAEPRGGDKIFVSEALFKYAKPYVLSKLSRCDTIDRK